MIRVGGQSDGGYVIPLALLQGAEVLVSMGLGYNWEFEKDARRLNPALRIQVYDHTVSEKLFTRELITAIAASFMGKVGWAMVQRRLRRLRDYRAFFGHDAIHFQERIHDRRDKKSVDIQTVFARAGLGRIFLKTDIEGTEYRVLEDVVSYSDRIIGLVIEFHHIVSLRSVFARTMEIARQRFEIVHVHANNFMPVSRDGIPEALEITLARNDLLPAGRRKKVFHLQEFDRPNDTTQPDYRLRLS